MADPRCEEPFWSGVPTGTRETESDPAVGPRVPGSTPLNEETQSGAELADAIEAEVARERAYWERLFKVSRYESVEQLRNSADFPRWRAIEAQKLLAAKAARHPSRTVRDDLGAVRGRPSRQVNVKLSLDDFETLKALAVDRDMPPSSLARILLRRALTRAALREG